VDLIVGHVCYLKDPSHVIPVARNSSSQIGQIIMGSWISPPSPAGWSRGVSPWLHTGGSDGASRRQGLLVETVDLLIGPGIATVPEGRLVSVAGPGASARLDE